MTNSTTDQHTPVIEVRASARRYPMTRGEEREFRSKTRIYFFPSGESILDNLMNRRSRPYELYREQLPEVFRRIGWGRTDPTPEAHWSQRAGCSCPCSPGFVLDRTLRGPSGQPIDIHVDIS